MVFAHSRNEAGERHDLGEHLRAVAGEAERSARRFGGADLARWVGLAHDLGKASDAFQTYLAACEREPHKRHPTTDHKGVGTLLAAEGDELGLASLVDGHHGGLPDHKAMKTEGKRLATDQNVAAATARANDHGLLPPSPADLAYPPFVKDDRSQEFFLRMLFSTLVDADHADTERHFEPAKTAQRGRAPSLADLATKLEADQARLTGKRDDPVGQVRDEVYRACLAAAPIAPGFFRLSVPTGGGKTRSGLAFALRHALAHGLERVIVAVPYLTITDQTAKTYRDIFDDPRAVLEHHSGAGRDDVAGASTPAATWARLAAEDWDAPIIVTTTVQLFESLFGRKPTVCRKLHRLARSVIILDEVQALPTPLLPPILDALRELATNYGASVVLSTATQPAYAEPLRRAGLGDLPLREIAPDPPRLFQILKRVDYHWPAPDQTATWDEIAAQLRAEPRALAVLNTKNDALALLDALADPAALHLSTSLCGAHRREVLAEIKRRLAAGDPCRLVSTQVVEAGVDLDFPAVFRALGPLDGIIQAAGRCNREGRPERGRVVVFRPAEGGLPPGAYTTAAAITETLLAAGHLDPDEPATVAAYFHSLYQIAQMEPGNKVQRLRQNLAYEQVAEAFQMIGDDTAFVLVPYVGPSTFHHRWETAPEARAFRQELKQAARGGSPGAGRELLRRCQPFMVGVRRRPLEDAVKDGLAVPLIGDVWAWTGRYDAIRGVLWDNPAADGLVF